VERLAFERSVSKRGETDMKMALMKRHSLAGTSRYGWKGGEEKKRREVKRRANDREEEYTDRRQTEQSRAELREETHSKSLKIDFLACFVWFYCEDLRENNVSRTVICTTVASSEGPRSTSIETLSQLQSIATATSCIAIFCYSIDEEWSMASVSYTAQDDDVSNHSERRSCRRDS